MANVTPRKPASTARKLKRGTAGASKAASPICFTASLLEPATGANGKTIAGDEERGWTFLILPRHASAKLRSRSRTSVAGAINGSPFHATLDPDGQGGHWLKVERKLRESAGAAAGDVVAVEITPLRPDQEPEPKVPADLGKALAVAAAKARAVWSDITPIARRDWVHWVVSAKQAETRARRIKTACEMLAKGKRRPCCFDRSGMYGKSLSCPTPRAG